MENPARYLAEIARLRAALTAISYSADHGAAALANSALSEGPQITEEEGAFGATFRRLTLGDIGVRGSRESEPLIVMPAQPAPGLAEPWCSPWHEHEECLRVQADLIADVRELVENLDERLDKEAKRIDALGALRLNFEAHIAEQVGFWSTTEDRLSALESRISDESDLRGAQIVNLQIEVHGGNLDGRPVVGLIDRLSAIEAKLAVQIVPDLSEVVAEEMGASGAEPLQSWISYDEAIVKMSRFQKALERIAGVMDEQIDDAYPKALAGCTRIAREALGR